MADFSRLKTTLAYARLGLVSLTAATFPITGTAQELCGARLFEGERNAAELMNRTVEFLNILENSGVVAFHGAEGRMSIDAARRSLQDGVGSATLLVCVLESEAIEFTQGAGSVVVGCSATGRPSLFQQGSGNAVSTAGRLFCTSEVASISQYLGSET